MKNEIETNNYFLNRLVRNKILDRQIFYLKILILIHY